MAVFTNSDIKKRRELLKMTAATLAEMIGRDPTTIYNWESGKCDPDPDSLYQIAEALGDLNIWYDWMRTKYSSYARLHPEGRANDLPGATMTMFAELADLVDALRSESVDPQAPEHDATLLQFVCLHRATELAAGLRRALMKQGLQRFVVDTLAPLAAEVGEAWMRGELVVADEHLFTEQVQNLLRGAIGAQAGSSGRPRILLTTLPDELHVLGLLMAEAMLVPEGVSCTSLGTRTPLADIRAATLAGVFDVVALSFSSAYPTRQAVDDLLELRASLPAHVALWAGGGAVHNRHKRLDGVRVVDGLEDTLIALHEWRDAHPSHPG